MGTCDEEWKEMKRYELPGWDGFKTLIRVTNGLVSMKRVFRMADGSVYEQDQISSTNFTAMRAGSIFPSNIHVKQATTLLCEIKYESERDGMECKIVDKHKPLTYNNVYISPMGYRMYVCL